MSDKVLGIILRAQADINKAVDDLKSGMKDAERQATTSAKKTSEEYERSFEKIRNAGAVAFAALSAGIGFAVKEAVEAQSGLVRAQAAVELNGKSWQQMGDRVQAAAARIQETTRFTDDEAIAAFTRLTLVTGDSEASLALLAKTTDIAAVTGDNLESVAQQIALAMDGQVGRLGKLVPGLRDMNKVLGENASAEERLKFITDELSKGLGNFAEKEAKSAAGQLLMVKKQIGEVGESIGTIMLPMVLDMAKKVENVARAIKAWTEEHPGLTKAILGAGLTVSGFLLVVGGGATVILKTKAAVDALKTSMLLLKVLNPEWLAIAALAAGAGVMAYAIGDAMTAGAKWQTELDKLSKELGGTADDYQRLANSISQFDPAEVQEKFPKYIEIIRAARQANLDFDASMQIARDTSGDLEKALAIIAARAAMVQAEATTGAASVEDLSKKFDFKPISEYNREIAYLREVIQGSTDPAVIGQAKQALQTLQDELEELRTGGQQTAQFFEDTFKAAMESGMGAAEATALARTMPSLPAVEIEASSPGKILDLELTMQQEANAAKLAEDRRAAAQRVAIWEQAMSAGVDAEVAAQIMMTSTSAEQAEARLTNYQREYEAFLSNTQAMQDAFATGMNTITDVEMTGKERREAIWNSFKQSATRQITEIVTKHVWGEMAKRAAMIATGMVQKTTAAQSAAAENVSVLKTLANLAKTIAAKVYGFYASFGPFGIPLAAATIAAVLAAIRAIKFQTGGVVPGSGRGDHVPAMLEPGEFVVNRGATERYRTLLEQINSGQKGSWLIAAKLAAGGVVRRNVATTPAEYAYADRVARTEAQIAQAFASGSAALSPVEQNNVSMTVHLDRDADERDVSRIKHLVDTWVVESVEAAIDRGAFRRRFAFA